MRLCFTKNLIIYYAQIFKILDTVEENIFQNSFTESFSKAFDFERSAENCLKRKERMKRFRIFVITLKNQLLYSYRMHLILLARYKVRLCFTILECFTERSLIVRILQSEVMFKVIQRET